MKERPIIFSPESVRAILDGRKTQTRRIVKPQPPDESSFEVGFYEPAKIDRNGELYPGKEVFGITHLDGEWGRVCPYGAPSNRLWVRERYGLLRTAQGKRIRYTDEYKSYLYTNEGEYVSFEYIVNEKAYKWQNPMFMPRRYSRLTLEITDIRCERLQDITEEDAIKEGVGRCIWFQPHGKPETESMCFPPSGNMASEWLDSHKASFCNQWERLNAKRGFAWDTNPFVWVIEFRKVEGE